MCVLWDICRKLFTLSVISWYRAGQKSKQLTMDADPSDCSPHQQQQPEPASS